MVKNPNYKKEFTKDEESELEEAIRLVNNDISGFF